MALARIKIKINSTVINEDDPIPEYSEELYSGFMRYTDGGVDHISYKSVGNGASSDVQIDLLGSVIRLVRSGAIESEMLFEVGVTHKSIYKIPPFSFDMELTAKKAENTLSPLGGALTLEYKMSVGGALKDCVMKIAVTPC